MEYKLIQSSKIEEDDAPITKILLNRGIEREDIMKYLNPLDEYILPPEDLYNMRAGAELLAKHIAMQSQTLVVVDSDQDGYASAALIPKSILRCTLKTLQVNSIISNLSWQPVKQENN